MIKRQVRETQMCYVLRIVEGRDEERHTELGY
jgi:hypothetical protein